MNFIDKLKEELEVDDDAEIQVEEITEENPLLQALLTSASQKRANMPTEDRLKEYDVMTEDTLALAKSWTETAKFFHDELSGRFKHDEIVAIINKFYDRIGGTQ